MLIQTGHAEEGQALCLSPGPGHVLLPAWDAGGVSSPTRARRSPGHRRSRAPIAPTPALQRPLTCHDARKMSPARGQPRCCETEPGTTQVAPGSCNDEKVLSRTPAALSPGGAQGEESPRPLGGGFTLRRAFGHQARPLTRRDPGHAPATWAKHLPAGCGSWLPHLHQL